MNDMRQKLLPVFLEEAGRKIAQLDGFLAAVGGEGKSLDDLEAAFRAAHTLKGTAALVQAEAVRSLSARMEGLLEGHFEQQRFPSEVEYEAMQLALDRLKQLIDAVEKKQDEPAGLLAEAELALKLAMSMPGRKRLVELLEVEGADDPFADDPDFAVQTTPLPIMPGASTAEDPFADDPGFDPLPVDSVNHGSEPTPEVVDPFADDPELDISFTEEALPPVASTSAPFVETVDPFAEDPALEYVQDEIPAGSVDSDSVPSSSTREPSISEQDLVAEPPAESAPAPVQEESFIDRMRKRLEKESSLQTAERLARSLLAQSEDEAVARQYACCHFCVAAKDYYLPIENMVEIADLPPIIHLPLAPAVVRGLINLRGQVLPVIDLGAQAGTPSQYVAIRKLVIAEAGGEKLAFLSEGIPDLSETIIGEKVDVMNFVDQFRAGAS